MSDDIDVPEYCLVALDAARVALRLLGDLVHGATTLQNVTKAVEFINRESHAEVVQVRAWTGRHGPATVLCHVYPAWNSAKAGKVSVTWKGLDVPYAFDFESWGGPPATPEREPRSG